jgi:AAA15 family ATPase/GTPase
MYQIKIENCNNIAEGELAIEDGKLNIFYGINGTGKTTIAKAIVLSREPQKEEDFQSFFAENPAFVSISPEDGKILVFNDDFVRDIVFKEDEVKRLEKEHISDFVIVNDELISSEWR